MRNFFVNYRGGAASRSGTAYCGMCKQDAPNAGGTPTDNQPRLIQFQFNIDQGYALEFGDQYMRILSNGSYIIETAKNVSAITQANPGIITATAHGFNNGDWIFGQAVGGMTEFNGLIWIVQNKTTNTFTLTDLFGVQVNTNVFPPYTSGGTFSRIYTVVSPYAAIDLPYLKFTQSADTMSLTCVNQSIPLPSGSAGEYPPYDLTRIANTNWTFTEAVFSASIAAPSNLAAVASSSTTLDTWYSYVVTAVAADGEESIASEPVYVQNNDISINAGSNSLNWRPVSAAVSYNIYEATPVYSTSGTNQVPVGVLYGFIGRSLATNFVDTNITADFTKVPPTHQNPFAVSAIVGATVVLPGSGYTQAGVTYSITTSTGTGAILEPIVSGGSLIDFVVLNGGQDYAPSDAITITADGTGATATLVLGPATGTYPGTVAYFQQRRVYANTSNNPDTYFMSQPGAFLNMDSSIPSSDSDAIIGAPWAEQINGIQFLVPVQTGLIALTGGGAWLVSGGNNTAITPADQSATAQAYNGCNNHVMPLRINQDVLYVQAKGSIVRDLAYNFFTNIYTGTDTTVLSNQLFYNFQINEWCYSEEPYKIVWAVRSDGVMLSFTYLKEQDVYGWARHDTNGLFVSTCSVTEPPVDAVYVIVQRYVQGQWIYYSERMDNRSWENVEQSWCVDAGLTLPLIYPDATLTPSAATGTSNISSVHLIIGGKGYTAPVITAIDESDLGTGATFTYTLSGGVITSITPVNQGKNYTPGATKIMISDSTGSSAIANPLITNNVNFTASDSVFTNNMVGDVIRVGGGKAIITSYVSGTQVVANITEPITNIVPDDPDDMPIPATQRKIYGDLILPNDAWTVSTPVTTITGLNHLNGKTVSILADGSVQPQQVVTNNSIKLQSQASQVTIGLPFTAQLQTMYLDPPSPEGTTQGKRKNIFGVTVRLEASRGYSLGTNQIDSSTQPNGATVPWTGLYPAKERNAQIAAGNSIPLFTGDEYLMAGAEWNERSQVAIETQNPLPVNVTGLVAWFCVGDTSG